MPARSCASRLGARLLAPRSGCGSTPARISTLSPLVPFGWPAGAVPEPYADILKLLRGCEPASTVRLRRAEKRGASWRQLCAIAHRSGFTFEQR